MPRYGEFRYGKLERYGKYNMSSDDAQSWRNIGPHVRYRIRLHSHDGKKSEFLTMHRERVSIPSNDTLLVRMRADDGDWIYVEQESVPGKTPHVRVRAISSDGSKSEWVRSDRGDLR